MSDVLDAILDETPREELRLFDLCDEVAGRIAAALDARGWTQRQLADALGKRESYVSRALAGGNNFTLKTIAQFEVALGMPLLDTGDVSALGPDAQRNEDTARFARPTIPPPTVVVRFETPAARPAAAPIPAGAASARLRPLSSVRLATPPANPDLLAV